jgi:hypothetical protein
MPDRIAAAPRRCEALAGSWCGRGDAAGDDDGSGLWVVIDREFQPAQ